MIKLVPIEDIHASDYNPRKNDEKRLHLAELSLRKLGFLLPIYATEDGEILSGHQRTLVAKRIGFEKVPVVYVENRDLRARKGVNLIFNRATNDLAKQDTCENINERLYKMDINAMIGSLPDIDPKSNDAFPCIYKAKHMDVLRLAKKNHRKFNPYTRQLARALKNKVGLMPIVIDPEENVINGIGRLEIAADAKQRVITVVPVSAEQAEFASAMLNLLSMDFNMQSTYADDLRYNSYRRETTVRATDANGNVALGNGFFVGIWPYKKGTDFFKLEGEDLETWRNHYGTSVVDFGACHLDNTRILEKAGVHCVAFEPYFVTSGGKIHKAKVLEIANRFLDDVESGTPYSTVFISSVFNSVPFMADRKAIAVISSALCYQNGKTVCWCQSSHGTQFIQTNKKIIAEEKRLTFNLDYEPNIILGEISGNPKVQKGHTEEEMREIFAPCFNEVKRLDLITDSWYMEVSDPKIDPAALAAALDFEFELPYPDGSRLGLSDRARKAFEHRLGITLPPKGGEENG